MRRARMLGICAFLWGLLTGNAVLDQPSPANSQRLFSIPYGESKGAVPLKVAYGHPDYEPDRVEGPTALLVSPNGSRIAVVVRRRNEEHNEVVEVFIYTRLGEFINKSSVVYKTVYIPGEHILPTYVMISNILYGPNNQLYIVLKGEEIRVYDAQGNLLDSLSKTYTDSFRLFNRDIRETIDMVGVDKWGSIYFSDGGRESYQIDPKGNRAWIDHPISRLSKDGSTIYLIKGRSPEVWVKRQGRLQRLCSIPSDSKTFDQLKQQYRSYYFRYVTASGQTYWYTYPHGDLNWSSIATIGGELHIATTDILVFDHNGRLVCKVPCFIAGGAAPVGGSDPWDIDANGNIYYLKWTEKSLEVWWVPISSSPSAQQSNK